MTISPSLKPGFTLVTLCYSEMVGHHDSTSYALTYAVPTAIYQSYEAEIEALKPNPYVNNNGKVRALIEELKNLGAVLHDRPDGTAAYIDYYSPTSHIHYDSGVPLRGADYSNWPQSDKPGIENPKPVREYFYDVAYRPDGTLIKGHIYLEICRRDKTDAITNGTRFKPGAKPTPLTAEEIAELNKRQEQGLSLELKPEPRRKKPSSSFKP